MAELGYADLPAAVLARFENNSAAQAAVDEALVAARRFCGWHVSPVREDEVVEVDGPGGRVLSLPTLNLIELSTVVENGSAVDVLNLDVSRRKGTVEKYPYGCWTSRAGGITVTMTHGFTEAEAADWRRAVIDLVDSRSQSSTRESSDMKRKRIDDVEYEWFEALMSTDVELSAKFSQFRILPSP